MVHETKVLHKIFIFIELWSGGIDLVEENIFLLPLAVNKIW